MRQRIENAIKNRKKNNIVNLNGMDIDDRELAEIMDLLLLSNKTITVINLDSNKISDVGAKKLADTLVNFHNLKEFSVQFNSIGEKGALDLFSLKQENQNLKIFFHGNQIHDVSKMMEIEQQALNARKFTP